MRQDQDASGQIATPGLFKVPRAPLQHPGQSETQRAEGLARMHSCNHSRRWLSRCLTGPPRRLKMTGRGAVVVTTATLRLGPVRSCGAATHIAFGTTFRVITPNSSA